MRSYQNHLTISAEPAAAGIKRKPTLRSSAIFPVFHKSKMTTRICFLGYWMIKRNIQEIHSVVTLRSKSGETMYRYSYFITEAKAYRVEVEDLLQLAGWHGRHEFTGSVEIEFFSTRNLVYPYPAVVVNYYGSTFSSIVHTAQRVYNDSEDRDAQQVTAVPEAGFNIYADDYREPFITFINGFAPVVDGSIVMNFINDRRETMDITVQVNRLAPYETTVIYPEQYVDLVSFLQGRPGTAKVKFDVDWIFPRIIVGNSFRNLESVSVTHTYYDCSALSSAENYWQEAPPGWHHASLYIPVSVANERYTNVYFYPVYSPTELVIDVEIYDANGVLKGIESNAHHIVSSATDKRGLFIIDFRSLCIKHGIDPDQLLGANLIARPKFGSRVPARLKIGLDYGSRIDALPCNICKTMEVFNPALENKSGSFHWAPIVTDQTDAVIWVVNSNPMNPYRRSAEINMTFYRERDTSTMVRQLHLQPNGIACLRLSEEDELRSFFQGQMSWYTITSANPHVKSYYLCESSSGIVGGDHDF